MMEAEKLAQLIAKTLIDKKGMDVLIIDIALKSGFADYFVMASAGSERHLEALKDAVEDALEPLEIFPKRVEGKKPSGWILMDYGDVVVNIMDIDMREKYNLEKIWGDCEIVKIS
ncbi:MAG: ribosome silencing factor [Bacillota bacterium]|nr:ribosome silencing factor [Bacillota bacterium]